MHAKPEGDVTLILAAPIMLSTSLSAATVSTRTGSSEACNAVLSREPTKQNLHATEDKNSNFCLNFKLYVRNRQS